MTATRLKSFDFVKGVACIAIVLIHYTFPGDAGQAVRAVGRFAVPMFLVISGFFLTPEKKLNDTKLVGKIIKTLRLLLAAGLGYAVFTVAWNKLTVPGWDLLGYTVSVTGAGKIVRLLAENGPLVYGHLWFLMAQVYCYALILLTLRSEKRFRILYAAVPLLLLANSCLQEFSGVLPIKRSLGIPGTDARIILVNLFVFRALPFMLAGMLLRFHMDKVRAWKISRGALLGLVALGAAMCVAERFLFGDSQCYIGVYVMVFAMSVLCVKEPDAGAAPIVFLGEKLSMYVYVSHIAVGKVVNYAYDKLALSQYPAADWCRPLVVIAATLLVSLGWYAFKRMLRGRSAPQTASV